MPPNNENPEGGNPRDSHSSATNSANDKSDGNRKRGPRHAAGQLPLVRAATVHEPFPGQKKAMVLPDDSCPHCGFRRLHWADWPAPALVWKRCRCGRGYELSLYPLKAKRRGGWKAAI